MSINFKVEGESPASVRDFTNSWTTDTKGEQVETNPLTSLIQHLWTLGKYEGNVSQKVAEMVQYS